MPIQSRFMEPLGPQGAARVDVLESCGPNVDFVLKRCAPISRPVDVARTLKRFGLGLSDAHAVLNRIVADETVEATLYGPDRTIMIATLLELGVAAE
jgi:hypothetical protein